MKSITRCRIWSLLGASFVLLSWMASAKAEPSTSRALSLWERGLAALYRGDLNEAERSLRVSYELRPLGGTACDLARVVRRMGRPLEASEWFERCSADLGLQEVERLEARAAARYLVALRGHLRVVGGTPGERILIDGELRGELPLDDPLELEPGTHRIEVIDNAGEAYFYNVELEGGGRSRVNVSLRDDSGPNIRDRRRVPRWAFWTTLALSLAVTVVAGVAIGYDLDLSRYHGSEAQADQWRLTSAILGGVAGGGLAATLIMIPYLRPRDRGEASHTLIGPRADAPSWLGVSLQTSRFSP